MRITCHIRGFSPIRHIFTAKEKKIVSRCLSFTVRSLVEHREKENTGRREARAYLHHRLAVRIINLRNGLVRDTEGSKLGSNFMKFSSLWRLLSA